MNINLGAPYLKIIDDQIKKGYAGTRAEVVRQALMALNPYADFKEHGFESEEEFRLVAKAIKASNEEIKSGKAKLIPWEEVKRELHKKK